MAQPTKHGKMTVAAAGQRGGKAYHAKRGQHGSDDQTNGGDG